MNFSEADELLKLAGARQQVQAHIVKLRRQMSMVEGSSGTADKARHGPCQPTGGLARHDRSPACHGPCRVQGNKKWHEPAVLTHGMAHVPARENMTVAHLYQRLY